MRRSLLATAVAFMAVSLAVSSCSGSPSETGSSAAGSLSAATTTGGTLTIGAALDAASWDPADAEFGNRIQYVQPVYDSLLHLTADLTIEPWLATSFEYDAAKTTLTLTLRDDVVFSDGQKLDAAAVKANLEHFKNGTGQNSITLAAVDSIDTVGTDQVVLLLSAPDPALLRNLALVAGMQASPAALDSDALKMTPVGSGPYLLDAAQTTVGSQYTYTRNPDYWNPDVFPYDSIVIKPMSDLTARLNALKSGEIDATLADAKSISEAQASGLSVDTMEGDFQGLFIVDRDGTKVPALADPRVRQAMSYAIDAQGLLSAVRLDQGSLTNQIFSPSSQAYDPSLDGTYTYDPAKAKQLLAEAGYPNGFTITMPEFAGFADLSTPAYQQLGDVGITVKTENVPVDQVFSRLLSGDYPAFIFSWGSSDAWQDILKLVKPDAPWNMYHSETPELDALISAAQSEGTDAAFQAVSKYLVDNAWFAPWYVQNNIYLSAPSVKVTMQPQNVVPYIWDYAPAS